MAYGPQKYGIRTPPFTPYEPFLLGVGVVLNLLKKSTGKNSKQKIQWRPRPEIADFCPLSWSNVSWSSYSWERSWRNWCRRGWRDQRLPFYVFFSFWSVEGWNVSSGGCGCLGEGRLGVPGQVWEFRFLPFSPSFPRENRSSRTVWENAWK